MGKSQGNSGDLVCEEVGNIVTVQEQKQHPFAKFCVEVNEYTIPVIFYCDEHCNEPLCRLGNIGELTLDEYGCFSTVFYRIEKVDLEKCVAVLSLLRPLDKGGCLIEDTCDVYRLERTKYCVEIDLTTISSLQVLEPALVNRPFPCPPPK